MSTGRNYCLSTCSWCLREFEQQIQELVNVVKWRKKKNDKWLGVSWLIKSTGLVYKRIISPQNDDKHCNHLYRGTFPRVNCLRYSKPVRFWTSLPTERYSKDSHHHMSSCLAVETPQARTRRKPWPDPASRAVGPSSQNSPLYKRLKPPSAHKTLHLWACRRTWRHLTL